MLSAGEDSIRPSKRWILGLAGTLVSLVCVWLAFRSVPLDELAHAFAAAKYWWLLPALIVQVLGTFARARRWQILLLDRVTFSDAFWALLIGLLGNNILPLRAGEAARVIVLNQQTAVPLAQVAASVLIERSLDIAVILVLLVLLLPLMQVPPVALAAALALGSVLAIAAVLLLVLMLWRGHSEAALGALAARLPAPIDRIVVGRGRQFFDGFAPLRDPHVALRVAVWSVVSWAATVALCWCVLEAVVPGSSVIEASFMTVATSLGISLPSSPGYVGVFQFVGQQALVVPFPERYNPSSALSVALIVHGLYYVFTCSLGVVGLLRMGITLSALRHASIPSPSPTKST
jgi:glycosyltransferase 2 family protein